MEQNENHDEQERSDGNCGLPRVRVGRVQTQGRRAHGSRVLDDLYVPKKMAKVRRTRGRKHPEPEEKNRFNILCFEEVHRERRVGGRLGARLLDAWQQE